MSIINRSHQRSVLSPAAAGLEALGRASQSAFRETIYGPKPVGLDRVTAFTRFVLDTIRETLEPLTPEEEMILTLARVEDKQPISVAEIANLTNHGVGIQIQDPLRTLD